MQFQLLDNSLRIRLNWCERIIAISLNSEITIPLSHITNVSIGNEAPNISGYTLRAPGTHIPYFIKAGTFYTSVGCEFWYITQNTRNYLVLTLQNEDFVRIVLTVKTLPEWLQQFVSDDPRRAD